MISRTLGAEFGGSVGTLFYFANVVSSALYLAACTEGVVSNFGPTGSLVKWLPGGFWWNFAYSSFFNLLNLIICLIGAKWFGRTSAFILASVVACTLVTLASFFPNKEILVQFEEACYEPTNHSIIENCTETINGTFTGLAASSSSKVEELLISNMYPRYERDCSDPTIEVSILINVEDI